MITPDAGNDPPAGHRPYVHSHRSTFDACAQSNFHRRRARVKSARGDDQKDVEALVIQCECIACMALMCSLLDDQGGIRSLVAGQNGSWIIARLITVIVSA
jgi:hypothetical protein